MSALSAVITAGLTAATLIFAIVAFNYAVDPMCYYRCADVDVKRPSANLYFQVAQRIAAHPDTQQILLGSSRAGTTSPYYLEKLTGLKTLNLTAGGAELAAKLAFLNLALEKTQVRRVIWYADYFESILENADPKLKMSPALMRLLGPQASALGFKNDSSFLPTLLDHTTLEASFHTLRKVDPAKVTADRGGSEGEYGPCDRGEYKGKETAKSLAKKVDLLYENYTRQILKPAPSEKAWPVFEEAMRALKDRKIEVEIVIIPYHPEFTRRLKAEFPKIYDQHQQWIAKFDRFRDSEIKVVNYFDGIPGDDGGPDFWNDGVHFRCRGVIGLLVPAGS